MFLSALGGWGGLAPWFWLVYAVSAVLCVLPRCCSAWSLRFSSWSSRSFIEVRSMSPELATAIVSFGLPNNRCSISLRARQSCIDAAIRACTSGPCCFLNSSARTSKYPISLRFFRSFARSARTSADFLRACVLSSLPSPWWPAHWSELRVGYAGHGVPSCLVAAHLRRSGVGFGGSGCGLLLIVTPPA